MFPFRAHYRPLFRPLFIDVLVNSAVPGTANLGCSGPGGNRFWGIVQVV